MGYKTKVRSYLIQFAEGHEFHGAEARVKGMTLGEYMEALGIDGGEGDKAVGSSLRRFLDHLISWNLEDEDEQPVPPTAEGAALVDHDLVLALSNAWVQQLLGVHDADPLPQSSTSGEPFPEVSEIPTEPLLSSQAS